MGGGGGGVLHGLLGGVVGLCDGLGGVLDVCGFVSFASVWGWCEVWCVGFEEDACEWYVCYCVFEVGVFECDDAVYSDEVIGVLEDCVGLLWGASEAMEYGFEWCVGEVAECVDGLLECVAHV